MKQANTNTQALLAAGHGAQVIKDTILASLIVSATINLSVLVSWAAFGA